MVCIGATGYAEVGMERDPRGWMGSGSTNAYLALELDRLFILSTG